MKETIKKILFGFTIFYAFFACISSIIISHQILNYFNISNGFVFLIIYIINLLGMFCILANYSIFDNKENKKSTNVVNPLDELNNSELSQTIRDYYENKEIEKNTKKEN